MTIVVYCPACDYFLKTAAHNEVGTHGCACCGHLMEVYIPQEFGRPDYLHEPGLAAHDRVVAAAVDRERGRIRQLATDRGWTNFTDRLADLLDGDTP